MNFILYYNFAGQVLEIYIYFVRNSKSTILLIHSKFLENFKNNLYHNITIELTLLLIMIIT